MPFNREKDRDDSGQVDIRRLKREIHAELTRVQGGELAQAAPAAGGTRRPRSVIASPLIQEAALGQIGGIVHTPADGGAHKEGEASSPYGALRHLVDRFESAAARLERQVDRAVELTARLAGDETRDTEQHRPSLAPVEEPRYQPDDAPMQVMVAAVPGSHILMEMQRALSALPATADATVLEFDQGDALLHLTLRKPVSLGEIMEGLRQTAGHALLVEESRPEASRLRLRFIPQPAARSELQP